MSTIEKVKKATSAKEKFVFNQEIIVYNDDINTFDHVIETLVRVCDHTSEQAEQCALLIHYKGKCGVKTGSFDTLKPLCLQLLSAGLTAAIE